MELQSGPTPIVRTVGIPTTAKIVKETVQKKRVPNQKNAYAVEQYLYFFFLWQSLEGSFVKKNNFFTVQGFII